MLFVIFAVKNHDRTLKPSTSSAREPVEGNTESAETANQPLPLANHESPKLMPRPIIAALFILAASLIPATLQAQSVDDLDRDNGALGHKFGERLSAFKGLAVDNQSKDGRVKVIIDKSPKQDFFGIAISTVIYRFYNDRFYEIYLYFKDRETAEKAFAKADARYGDILQYSDAISGLVLLRHGFDDDGLGFLDFVSIPLNHAYSKWNQKN